MGNLIEFDLERFNGACYDASDLMTEALGIGRAALWLKKTGKSSMSIKQINALAQALDRDATDFIKVISSDEEIIHEA